MKKALNVKIKWMRRRSTEIATVAIKKDFFKDVLVYRRTVITIIKLIKGIKIIKAIIKYCFSSTILLLISSVLRHTFSL